LRERIAVSAAPAGLALPRRKGLQIRPTIFENLNLRHIAVPRHAYASPVFSSAGVARPAGPAKLKT
jgi:hypothetical protein